MWYYDRMKELIGQKKMTVVTLCEKVGITEGGFYASIRNNSMKINTMDRIATALDVELKQFFVKPQADGEAEESPVKAGIQPEEEVLRLKEKINMLNEQLLDAVFMLDEEKMRMFKQKWSKN